MLTRDSLLGGRLSLVGLGQNIQKKARTEIGCDFCTKMISDLSCSDYSWKTVVPNHQQAMGLINPGLMKSVLMLSPIYKKASFAIYESYNY